MLAFLGLEEEHLGLDCALHSSGIPFEIAYPLLLSLRACCSFLHSHSSVFPLSFLPIIRLRERRTELTNHYLRSIPDQLEDGYDEDEADRLSSQTLGLCGLDEIIG